MSGLWVAQQSDQPRFSPTGGAEGDRSASFQLSESVRPCYKKQAPHRGSCHYCSPNSENLEEKLDLMFGLHGTPLAGSGFCRAGPLPTVD